MADHAGEPKRPQRARTAEQPGTDGGMSPSRYSGGEFASHPARSAISETSDVPRGTSEAVENTEQRRSVENSQTPLESTPTPVENSSKSGNESAESMTPDSRL